MIPELTVAAKRFEATWRRFVDKPEFFQIVGWSRPTPAALGIKVADAAEYWNLIQLYEELGDQVHSAMVDDRRIATILKPEPFALGCVRQVKILQRRSGRNDTLGPEHLDLVTFAPIALAGVTAALQELDVECEIERNKAHEWLKIIVEGMEFKLVDHHVWRVCIQEMRQGLDSLPAK